MAVTFSALRLDGTQYIDGFHDYTINDDPTAQGVLDQMAAQWPTTWPDDTPFDPAVPGQSDGRHTYQVVNDVVDANLGNWDEATTDIWNHIHTVAATSYRLGNHIFDWR